MEPADGFIDLVKVTEDYSPALQAATARVEHASTDPALAQALAEKAELEQQLKVKSMHGAQCEVDCGASVPLVNAAAAVALPALLQGMHLPLLTFYLFCDMQ